MMFIYDDDILMKMKIMSLMRIFMTKMMNNGMIMMAALMLNKVFNGEEKLNQLFVAFFIHHDDPQEDQHHDLKPGRYSFL